MPDPSKFTQKTREAIESAQSKALRLSHQEVDVEHLLAALLEQEEGLVPLVLERAGAPVPTIRSRIEEELQRRRYPQPRRYDLELRRLREL